MVSFTDTGLLPIQSRKKEKLKFEFFETIFVTRQVLMACFYETN